MKESLKLRKQQLEQNILEAEKTWNRLEKFFNIFIIYHKNSLKKNRQIVSPI